MFDKTVDKVKNFNKLRKTQSEMKKQMEQIFVSNEYHGMSILVRGDKKIEKISLNGAENKELKDFLNDSMKQVDKKLEKQMRGHLGDLGFGDL